MYRKLCLAWDTVEEEMIAAGQSWAVSGKEAQARVHEVMLKDPEWARLMPSQQAEMLEQEFPSDANMVILPPL